MNKKIGYRSKDSFENEKEYNFTVPEEWKPENCYIIAFVHLGGDSKEVLQAVEVHMVP